MSGPFVGFEEKRRIEALEARAVALEAGPLGLAAVGGVETANVIRTTITCTDGAGAAVPAARVLVELLTDGLVPVDMASQAFDIVTGTALSADNAVSNIAMLIEADAGVIAVDVTDKSTALAGDVWLRLTPIGREGPVELHTLTFA